LPIYRGVFAGVGNSQGRRGEFMIPEEQSIDQLRTAMPHLNWRDITTKHPNNMAVFEASSRRHRVLCGWFVWQGYCADSPWKAAFHYNGAEIQVAEGSTAAEAIDLLRKRVQQSILDIQSSLNSQDATTNPATTDR
jgi:hypothetical protein